MSGIKTVVIAAAGQGTRMLELTKTKSKHLIHVQERPFLAYLMDNILSAGYNRIILVVGYREDMMKKFLKTYSFEGKRYDIEMVNQFDVLGPKEKEYGTACPVKCVQNIINEPFIFLCGDHYYSARDLQSVSVTDDYHYISGLVHENPERYGVLFAQNGLLSKIVEKPKEFVGDLINVSLYKFTPAVFDKIPLIQKSPRGEYEITDAINLLAQEGKVKINRLQDYWIDFGRPEDIKTFSDYLLHANHKTFAKSA